MKKRKIRIEALFMRPWSSPIYTSYPVYDVDMYHTKYRHKATYIGNGPCAYSVCSGVCRKTYPDPISYTLGYTRRTLIHLAKRSRPPEYTSDNPDYMVDSIGVDLCMVKARDWTNLKDAAPLYTSLKGKTHNACPFSIKKINRE
jgi:hypothetical protein